MTEGGWGRHAIDSGLIGSASLHSFPSQAMGGQPSSFPSRPRAGADDEAPRPTGRGGRCGRVSPGPFPRSVRDPHISTRSPLPEAGIIRGSSRRRAHRGREAPVTSRAVILEKSHRFGARPRERDRHREAIWTPMSLFTPHKFGWHRDSPDPRDLVPTDELVCSLLDRLEPPRRAACPGRTGASTCRRPTTNATWPPRGTGLRDAGRLLRTPGLRAIGLLPRIRGITTERSRLRRPRSCNSSNRLDN